MGMQGLQVGAGDDEVADAGVGIELLVDDARGVFDELGIGAVELGESLLVLALDHDLGLRLEAFETKVLHVLDEQGATRGDLGDDAGLGTLRVRDAVGAALFAGMLGQLGRAGAGGGVDEVEMDVAAQAIEVVDGAFEDGAIILPAFEARAEGLLQDRVAELDQDAGAAAVEVLLVADEDFFEELVREHAVLELVEGPHDAGHVDTLAIGREGHRTGDRALERERLAVAGGHQHRQVEARDADVLDRDVGALDQGGVLVLHVRQRRPVGVVGAEIPVVAAGEIPAAGRMFGSAHDVEGGGKVLTGKRSDEKAPCAGATCRI